MGALEFSGLEIVGMAACVPKNSIDNFKYGKALIPDDEQLSKTISVIGIENRRVVDESICTSDLCLKASEQLLSELLIDKNDIDAVIFISQTGDYILPATSCLIQSRLGLKKEIMAFDVNLGCSGYVYGLSIAFSIASNPMINKVLLLAGDTSTKLSSKKDKSTALLFGDAGTATIIQKSDKGEKSFFNLFTDGSGYEALHVKDGGFRNQTSLKSFENHTDSDDNVRNSLQLYMNGGEIFNFTLREVPKSINNLLSNSNLAVDEIDSFVFHQANKFMIDFLAKKIKIEPNKFHTSLKNFGNTSSASIPLTLVANKSDNPYNKTLMSGFGVGLSWANCIVDLSKTKIIELVEYDQ